MTDKIEVTDEPPPNSMCHSKKDSNTPRLLCFFGNGQWNLLYRGGETIKYFVVIPSIRHHLLGQLRIRIFGSAFDNKTGA